MAFFVPNQNLTTAKDIIMDDDQYEAHLRKKFKREVLDPLGPMPHMTDSGYVETMFRDFVNEEEKRRIAEIEIEDINAFWIGEPYYIAQENSLITDVPILFF